MLNEEIIKSINQFYPIGFPQLITSYSGHKRIKEIVGKKIDEVQSEKENSWILLLQTIKAEINGVQLNNYDFFQFPSYIFEIKLHSSNHGEILSEKSILLIVSLLTQSFTVYVEQRLNILVPVIDEKGSEKIVSTILLYCNSANVPDEIEKIDFIKKVVPLFFRGYVYANHFYLIDTKVEAQGVPYGDDIESALYKKNSVFRYLFANNLILNEDKIINAL